MKHQKKYTQNAINSPTKIPKNKEKTKANLVSLFPRITVTTNPNNLPLLEVLEWIQKGDWKEPIEALRAIEEEKTYSKAKKQLPYFIPSGTFTKRKNDGIEQYNGFIVLDIDGLDSLEESETLKQFLIKDFPYAFAVFVSPSGKGLKILVRTDNQDGQDATHKKYFALLSQSFDNRGLQLDPSGKDISRACFVSYDGQLYLNENAPVLKLVQSSNKGKKQKVKLESEDEIWQRCLKAMENRGVDFTEGNRHLFSFQLACVCNRYGLAQSYVEGCFNQYYALLSNDPKHHLKNIVDVYQRYSKEHNSRYFEHWVAIDDNSETLIIERELLADDGTDTIVERELSPDIYLYEGRESKAFWYLEEKSDKDGNLTKAIPKFSYCLFLDFLEQHGFGRYEIDYGNDIYFRLLKDKIVREVKPSQVKDYARKFVFSTKVGYAKEMVIRAGKNYFAADKLENLDLHELDFSNSGKDYQYFFFKNHCWKITADKIEVVQYKDFPNYVWYDKVIDFEPSISKKPLFTINRDEINDAYQMEVQKNKDSHFLQYLLNTSNMNWEKEENQISEAEEQEHLLYFLNKVCAMGYLLFSHYNPSQRYAVIGMDLRESINGKANGGTGKSIFGQAASEMLSDVYFDGKRPDLLKKDFVFQQVNTDTDLLFFDDVPSNFAFAQLYTPITNQITVNKKGKDEFNLKGEQLPKIYISTNHAFKSNGNSDDRRQWLIGFSDYYHKHRSPKDEFGVNFFSREWSDKQWNQFYNVMALCVQHYLRFGKIRSQQDRLNKRKLRNAMGESFFQWAEDFYCMDADFSNVGVAFDKNDLLERYKNSLNEANRRYIDARKLKVKLQTYAQYKGWYYNKEQSGGRDYRNCVDYITLSRG